MFQLYNSSEYFLFSSKISSLSIRLAFPVSSYIASSSILYESNEYGLMSLSVVLTRLIRSSLYSTPSDTFLYSLFLITVLAFAAYPTYHTLISVCLF